MKNLLDYLNTDNKSLSDKIDFFYKEIEEKMKNGSDRYDIYLFVENILNNHYCDLPEDVTDAIYEFKTALVGDAAPASIMRFSGDPEDDNTLAKYVRSNIWKRQ